MAVISMKQLLEAGVHFGHQTRRWNPKMAQYIFTERNGIYIIDLQKTVRKADEAYNFVRDLAMSGKSILFVGTKKQAQESIAAERDLRVMDAAAFIMLRENAVPVVRVFGLEPPDNVLKVLAGDPMGTILTRD